MVTTNAQKSSSSHTIDTCNLNSTNDNLSNKSHECDLNSSLNTSPDINRNQIGSNNSHNCVKTGKLTLYHQNIRGLGNKSNEILNLWFIPYQHILCFTEHHLKNNEICSIPINSYKLAPYYCQKLCKGGGVCIYVHESIHCSSIDLSKFCKDKDIEICAVKLHHLPTNICILSIYNHHLVCFLNIWIP